MGCLPLVPECRWPVLPTVTENQEPGIEKAVVRVVTQRFAIHGHDLPAGRFVARLTKADAPALAERREAAGALFVGEELLAAGVVVPARD